MSKVRLCLSLIFIIVQHQVVLSEPSLWSSLLDMFSESCDLEDFMDDDSSESELDSDSPSSSQNSPPGAKPIFNLTLPPSKNGISVLVEKLNGQVAVNVNSLAGGGAEATTAAATTAAATTAGPTTTAKK